MDSPRYQIQLLAASPRGYCAWWIVRLRFTTRWNPGTSDVINPDLIVSLEVQMGVSGGWDQPGVAVLTANDTWCAWEKWKIFLTSPKVRWSNQKQTSRVWRRGVTGSIPAQLKSLLMFVEFSLSESTELIISLFAPAIGPKAKRYECLSSLFQSLSSYSVCFFYHSLVKLWKCPSPTQGLETPVCLRQNLDVNQLTARWHIYYLLVTTGVMFLAFLLRLFQDTRPRNSPEAGHEKCF